jgi:hypothetical protein
MSARNDDYTPDAPAWSDSDNIWFNPKDMGELTDPSTVLTLKGLSLHEIAHILLTPRAGSNLAKDVQKAEKARAGVWRAFNALEDQRIEMMLSKRFGNVAPWFKAAVAKFIMAEPEQWSLAYPILQGRKFLPKELRDQVRDLYEQQHNVVEIGDLIDRYIVLNLADPKNYALAMEIILRYNELVSELPDPRPNVPEWQTPCGGWTRIKDPAGHDERKHAEWKSSDSKPMSKAEQEKIADKVADAIAEDLAEGNGEGEGEGDGDEGDAEGGSTAQGDKQDTTPGGNGASSTGPSSLANTAERMLDEVMSSKSREIGDIMKQYNAEIELVGGGVSKKMEKLVTQNIPVPMPVVQASKSFANELERLRRDFDPGWVRRTESGRLNVQRYVTDTDLDECFDQWDNGREDAVDIEAVILLDVSGSMDEMLKGALESMWAIKRALDRTNASTTVMAFDHRSFLLYGANERAGNMMKSSRAMGGTEPTDALKHAKNILAESSRAIKLCIVITDGEWSYDKECDKMLKEFRRAGVITALAYVEDPSMSWRQAKLNAHGCEVAVHITNTSDLFTLGRSIVKLGVSRNLINSGS